MSDMERKQLSWPQHQPRTRVQDQKNNSAWKKSFREYLAALAKEFARMKVTRYEVTFNGPNDSRDPGVAVWFSRKHEESYKWQDILGIDNPYPTVVEIDDAYRKLAPRFHPDRNPGIDPTKFAELTMARRKAIDWVKGTDKDAHEYVIACDQYREARQNLYAVVGTIQSIRRIERLGATQLFEQAFHAFAVLPEKASEAIHV